MQINIDRYEALAARGAIRQRAWGDGQEQACLMSALVTGADSETDCVAQGWPLWLAEIAMWLFDGYPEDQAIERGRRLALAIKAADARGVQWERVFRAVRLTAVLPIAMEVIGESDEPWRVECRKVVQWSIDNGGEAAGAAARDRIETALLAAMEA